jgi:hypothetical protein
MLAFHSHPEGSPFSQTSFMRSCLSGMEPLLVWFSLSWVWLVTDSPLCRFIFTHFPESIKLICYSKPRRGWAPLVIFGMFIPGVSLQTMLAILLRWHSRTCRSELAILLRWHSRTCRSEAILNFKENYFFPSSNFPHLIDPVTSTDCRSQESDSELDTPIWTWESLGTCWSVSTNGSKSICYFLNAWRMRSRIPCA